MELSDRARKGGATPAWGSCCPLSGTHHRAAEGRVLGQHAGPLGLSPAACAPMWLGALAPVHDTNTLVAPNAATLRQWASFGHCLFLLWVCLLVPGQTLGCGQRDMGWHVTGRLGKWKLTQSTRHCSFFKGKATLLRISTERWMLFSVICTYSQSDEVDILNNTAQMSRLTHRKLKELAKCIGLKRVEMTSRSMWCPSSGPVHFGTVAIPFHKQVRSGQI